MMIGNLQAKIDCVVGARPNFIKIAPILRAFQAHGNCALRLIHTGQHYDGAMNDVFFAELGIRAPDINLGIGSGSHAAQTARIMLGLDPVLAAAPPDMLVVVGDVNSTLAAALVAAKLHIPVAHVEAGLRSNDRTMPEEINRLVTDRICDLLLTTEREAVDQLIREGVDPGSIHFVGNVMIDTLHANVRRSRPALDTIAAHAPSGSGFLECARTGFGLVTLHRPSNVDDPAILGGLVRALAAIAELLPLVFVVHPRTEFNLARAGLTDALRSPGILATPPLSYLDMIGLLKAARLAVTDSGGVQEETTALGVPCLTVRPNTERPITVSEGTNTLVGTDPQALIAAARAALSARGPQGRIPELWDGRAAERVAARVLAFVAARKTGQSATN